MKNGSVKMKQPLLTARAKVIWKLFGAVEREEKVISNFVACKACKKVYAFKPWKAQLQ